MKINKLLKLNLAFILFFAVLFSSCEKWIDTDINISPNNPNDVPMKLLIPSIEANMAFTLEGNDMVRPTNIWLQYYNGWARQSFSQARYVYKPSDVNNPWNTIYADILMDINQVLKKAEETKSPYYEGVAKVCLAFTLGTATDVWGDIPYSETMKGDLNLSPKYDSQQEIYNDIQTLLDEAITALSKPESENVVALENDLIYNGDLSKWIKAAYSLKARYALNLSKVNGNQAYTDALTYAANGFTSNADNFAFKFDETSNSPLYMFMADRGDINMASTFINMLLADGDNRILVYSSDGGSSVGSEPGTDVNEGIAQPGDYAAAKDASSYFMTYAELKFIQAEAYLAGGNTTDAYQAYLDGAVASNVLALGNAYGIDETDVVGWTWYTVISVGANNLTLELIMRQKYIAGFNTIQPYVDYRRTGYPVLARATGATKDIPVRFPYSQTELNYNANVPQGVTLYDKLWWDKD